MYPIGLYLFWNTIPSLKVPANLGCNISEYDSYNWSQQNWSNADLAVKNLQNAQNAQNTFLTFCWCYCQMWLGVQCSIWHNEWYDICQSDSWAPESGWILRFHSKYVRGFVLPLNLTFATDHWSKPFPASFSQLNSGHFSCNRSAGGTSYVTYQFTSSQMVIHNKQERQWNPTLAISHPRYSNSNIIDWREEDSSLQ